MPNARPVPLYNQAGKRGEQQSKFYYQSYLRKSVATYEFDHLGSRIKETVQRWSDKNGSVESSETIVSRERIITYY